MDSETLNRLSNIHPGEVLLQEFLIPMDITAYRLAKETFLPQTRVSAILKGKRSITADTALRFAKFFGTSAQFWLGLQVEFDLEEELRIHEDALRNIVPHAPTAA
jgi:addiction module HigA family antidote